MGCTQAAQCSFNDLRDALAEPDDDTEPPAISTGVYFGLGIRNYGTDGDRS